MCDLTYRGQVKGKKMMNYGPLPPVSDLTWPTENFQEGKANPGEEALVNGEGQCYSCPPPTPTSNQINPV